MSNKLPYQPGDTITLTEDDIQCLRSAHGAAIHAARLARYFQDDERIPNGTILIEYARQLADAAVLAIEDGRAVGGMAATAGAMSNIVSALGDIVALETDKISGRSNAEIKAKLAKRIRNARENMEKSRDRAQDRHDRIGEVLEYDGFSPEVERMLKSAHLLLGRGLMMFDHSPESASSSFELGQTVFGEARRLFILPDALRGEKVAGGSESAAHATNARHVPMRERRFARMRELVPKVGVDKAAAQCAVEGLGSFDAIKRQWNRHRPDKEKRDT